MLHAISNIGGVHGQVTKRAIVAALCYSLIICSSIIMATLGNSLLLRLNGFMALHSLVNLAGGILRTLIIEGKVELVLSALGLQKNANLYPEGIPRLQLVFSYAADITIFFASVSTVVEAVQRLAEPHGEAPFIAIALAFLHLGLVFYHYKFIMKWNGGGGFQSPYVNAIPDGSELTAMAASPIACVCGSLLAYHTRLTGIDVLAAILLSVYGGQWSGRRLVSSAYILASRSPLSSQGNNSTALASNTSGFQKALVEIRMIEGVLEVKEYTVWPITATSMGAILKVALSRNANEEVAGFRIREVFSGCVAQLIVECERLTIEAYQPIASTERAVSINGSAPPPQPFSIPTSYSLPPLEANLPHAPPFPFPRAYKAPHNSGFGYIGLPSPPAAPSF